MNELEANEAPFWKFVTPRCYGTRSPLKNIRARGRIIFLFFPRAARARAEIRQINSAILKVPDAALNS